MAAAEIQVVNPANLQKIESFFNDSAYREAIENSANFNTRLCVERRLRMPFLDPQTGVAQTHCNLFMSRRQRMPGAREGQIYTYPAARWRKARRQYLSLQGGGGGRWGGAGWGGGAGGVGGGDGEGQEGQGDATSLDAHDTDSKDSHHRDKDDPNKEWFFDDIGMEELSGYDEPEPDSDEDYCDDSYSSGRRRGRGGGTSGRGGGGRGDSGRDGGSSSSKGKRSGRGGGAARDGDSSRTGGDAVETPPAKRGRGGGRGRKKNPQPQVLPYEVPGDAEKPYGCELCGVRYKTRPGLTYHYTHSHKEGAGGSDGDSREPTAAAPAAAAAAAGAAAPSLGDKAAELAAGQPSEYQDSYVTFLTGGTPPRRNRPASTTPITPAATSSTTSSATAPAVTSADGEASSSSAAAPTSPGAPGSPPPRNEDETSRSSGPPASPALTKGGKPAPSPYCDFCLGDHRENKKTGIPEELVSCSDCGRSGHPTCLQFTDNMIVSVRKYRWQCIECKCCSVCGTSDNDDQLLFCDDCDRGYHMYCLAPPLATPPEGSWSCSLCLQEFHHTK